MTISPAEKEEIGVTLLEAVVETATASTKTEEDIAVVQLAVSSTGVAMPAPRVMARNTSVMVNFIVTVIGRCNDEVVIVSWSRRLLFREKYQFTIENERQKAGRVDFDV